MNGQAHDSLEMQNLCAEIKLRAERRLGEMLGEMEKNKGGRPTGTPTIMSGVNPTTISDLGLDYKQSSRWQLMAQLPEDNEKTRPI